MILQQENPDFGNKCDTHMSSDNNEENGCGLDVDLLIILLQLRVQYPRSGCRAECPFETSCGYTPIFYPSLCHSYEPSQKMETFVSYFAKVDGAINTYTIHMDFEDCPLSSYYGAMVLDDLPIEF